MTAVEESALARGRTPDRRPTSARFARPLPTKTRRNRRAASRVLLARRAPRAAQSHVHVTRAATRQVAQAFAQAVLLASTRVHQELPAASMQTQATIRSLALRRSSRAALAPTAARRAPRIVRAVRTAPRAASLARRARMCAWRVRPVRSQWRTAPPSVRHARTSRPRAASA